MTHVARLTSLVSLHQVAYQFADGFSIFENLNLTFDYSRTAVIGRNGLGKSVLARLIAGQLSPASGVIERQVAVAYVAQMTAPCDGETVASLAGLAPALHAWHRLAHGEADAADLELVGDRWELAAQFQQVLTDAGLPELHAMSLASCLSGGQRARIALLGAFLSDAEMLVLDEPTNHLDQSGRSWLLHMLDQWRGGVIIVSHDRRLLMEVDRIIELTPAGARVYGGNYDVYRARYMREKEAALAALAHARTGRKREQHRLQREHDTIQRRAALSRKNADTANVSRPERYGMNMLRLKSWGMYASSSKL